MMSIKEKLAALQRQPYPEQTPAIIPGQMNGFAEIGLSRNESAQGTVWLRRKLITAAQIPMYPLQNFLGLSPQQLVLVGKSWTLQQAHPENLLFIDTETTGLAGGAGTYAFLVGIARCGAEGVEVKQYFLRDHSEERDLYRTLLADLEGIEALASYNGKSYDLPLIKNRCLLNRIDYGWDGLPHLDLLHSVRRLFKGLPTHGLGQVETDLLNFRRDGDVPGALIPGIYFNAIRSGDLAALKPIFQHNVMDLLSLIGITAIAAERFESSESLTGSELLAVVKTFSDLTLYEHAERACSTARSNVQDEDWIALARHRARLLKKQENFPGALRIWGDLIEQSPRFDPEPYEELAKYHEHRLGQFSEALAVIVRAEKRLEVLRELHQQQAHHDWNERLQRRKRRLLRKIAAARLAEAK